MQPYAWWFLLALIVLGLEMLSGTFYLLVFSLALAVGGLTALAGFDITLSFVATAIVGIVGTLVLRRRRRDSKPDLADATQHMDIGQPVHVEAWLDDGTARVRYRGAEWDAVLATPETPANSTLYIQQIKGSRLILTHLKD